MTDQSENRWLNRLPGFKRANGREERILEPAVYRQPSRQHRKSLVTWQDEQAIKELKHLCVDLGVTQQALVAVSPGAVHSPLASM